MTEVEKIIAQDLLANEYKGDPPDKAWLAESAARRVIKKLADNGYVIYATGKPPAG